MDGLQRPSAILKAEHQTILCVIGVLQHLVTRSKQGNGFEHDALTRCVAFFRLFANACHHGKEEDLLFPVLESRGIPRDGGPIGVMLHEHKIARRLTAQMAEALEAVRHEEPDGQANFHRAAHKYIELLTHPIYKEDNILFNMGDRAMNPEDEASLGTPFCTVNRRAFEGRRRNGATSSNAL